jgi:hypothetical protein
LELIVLWRGHAGWHEAGIGASGSDGTCPGTGDRCPGLLDQRYQIGAIDLRVILDRRGQVARVLGEEVALERTNVVLVDHIDGVDGLPTIVGTFRIPVELPSLELDVDALVQSDDRLTRFVR